MPESSQPFPLDPQLPAADTSPYVLGSGGGFSLPFSVASFWFCCNNRSLNFPLSRAAALRARIRSTSSSSLLRQHRRAQVAQGPRFFVGPPPSFFCGHGSILTVCPSRPSVVFGFVGPSAVDIDALFVGPPPCSIKSLPWISAHGLSFRSSTSFPLRGPSTSACSSSRFKPATGPSLSSKFCPLRFFAGPLPLYIGPLRWTFGVLCVGPIYVAFVQLPLLRWTSVVHELDLTSSLDLSSSTRCDLRRLRGLFQSHRWTFPRVGHHSRLRALPQRLRRLRWTPSPPSSLKAMSVSGDSSFTVSWPIVAMSS